VECDKIVCWVDAEMQERVTKEYLNREIILVKSLSDFKKNVTDNSLNLISASNFDDFDTSGFIYDVAEFFRSKPDQTFHVFLITEKDNSGLSSGELAKEPNVVPHLIIGRYNGKIQAMIDTGL
jgi:hypothetical protein